MSALPLRQYRHPYSIEKARFAKQFKIHSLGGNFMGLSQAELLELQTFKEYSNDENIRFKEIIEQKLCHDKRIIHVLNNPSLDEDHPEEYLWKNIFPHYVIPGTAADADNYICFETRLSDTDNQNPLIRRGKIIFCILCSQKQIFDEETGLGRHDLLAALIKDIFNWSDCFGPQIHVTKEVANVTDSHYVLRTLVFEIKTAAVPNHKAVK